MKIIHNHNKKEFFTIKDGFKAVVTYVIYENSLDIKHTTVPREIGGQGIAALLVKAAYDYAIENKLKPVATCAYAVIWLKRHPEYNGKESKDYIEGICSL